MLGTSRTVHGQVLSINGALKLAQKVILLNSKSDGAKNALRMLILASNDAKTQLEHGKSMGNMMVKKKYIA